jgi:hypothetical protein
VNKQEKMKRAIAAYLKEHGWNVVVAGEARVEHLPGDADFNFQFVLRFTGSKPEEEGNQPWQL